MNVISNVEHSWGLWILRAPISISRNNFLLVLEEVVLTVGKVSIAFILHPSLRAREVQKNSHTCLLLPSGNFQASTKTTVEVINFTANTPQICSHN